MSTGGQGTECRRNIAESFNRLSRVHERYRQTTDRQTDGRQQIANVNVSSRSLKIHEFCASLLLFVYNLGVDVSILWVNVSKMAADFSVRNLVDAWQCADLLSKLCADSGPECLRCAHLCAITVKHRDGGIGDRVDRRTVAAAFMNLSSTSGVRLRRGPTVLLVGATARLSRRFFLLPVIA